MYCNDNFLYSNLLQFLWLILCFKETLISNCNYAIITTFYQFFFSLKKLDGNNSHKTIVWNKTIQK